MSDRVWCCVVRSRSRGERGSTLPLIIVSAGLCFLLVAVVTDLSAAQLRRQSLSNVADGAALHAADLGAASDAAFRGGFGGPAMPLSDEAARAAAAEYLDRLGVRRRYPHLRLVSARVDRAEGEVEVVLREEYRMPFGIDGVGPSTSIRVSGRGSVQLSGGS